MDEGRQGRRPVEDNPPRQKDPNGFVVRMTIAALLLAAVGFGAAFVMNDAEMSPIVRPANRQSAALERPPPPEALNPPSERTEPSSKLATPSADHFDKPLEGAR